MRCLAGRDFCRAFPTAAILSYALPSTGLFHATIAAWAREAKPFSDECGCLAVCASRLRPYGVDCNKHSAPKPPAGEPPIGRLTTMRPVTLSRAKFARYVRNTVIFTAGSRSRRPQPRRIADCGTHAARARRTPPPAASRPQFGHNLLRV